MKATTCPFEKAILANQYSCSCSRRGQRGERALIECEQYSAYQDCLTYLKLARYVSRFALKIGKQDEQLPFGKQSKLLYGSLAALQAYIGSSKEGRDKDNIRALMDKVILKLGSIENFPYDTAVEFVSSYTARKRHRDSAKDS